MQQKAPNLNYFKMVNNRKQLKREQQEKLLLETILNKEDEFCNDSELKFKKNKHNEYRTALLKDYKKYLWESKLNNESFRRKNRYTSIGPLGY